MVTVRLRPSIILLGDSLAQFAFGTNGQVGWGQLLAQTYQRRADCFNRGFQGYTSKDILSDVLPDLLATRDDGFAGSGAVEDVPVLFWTILLGANDAALSSGRQGVSLDDFAKNVDEIVTTIRQHELNDANTCNTNQSEDGFIKSGEETPIILMTPPPCDVELWKKLDPDDDVPENGNDIYEAYANQLKKVAQQHTNCSVVDVWSLLGGDDPSSLTAKGYQSDGVHLTGEGNRVVFDGLMDVIQRDYPNFIPMTDGNGQCGEHGVPMEGKLWWMYNYTTT